MISLGLTQLVFRVLRGIWVESEKNLSVEQWVLLLCQSSLRHVAALDWSENSLDFGRVDQLVEIRLLNRGGWEEEVLLEG